ncbi:MAG: hypothetical protein ACTSW2_10070 [Alphaproteobacteria bacterium]
MNEAAPRNVYWRPWDEPGLVTIAGDGLRYRYESVFRRVWPA